MEPVRGHFEGPVVLTRDTISHGTVVGDMTVWTGVHLELPGNVMGNLMVRMARPPPSEGSFRTPTSIGAARSRSS